MHELTPVSSLVLLVLLLEVLDQLFLEDGVPKLFNILRDTK